MPNWCANKLNIIGDIKHLERFLNEEDENIRELVETGKPDIINLTEEERSIRDQKIFSVLKELFLCNNYNNDEEENDDENSDSNVNGESKREKNIKKRFNGESKTINTNNNNYIPREITQLISSYVTTDDECISYIFQTKWDPLDNEFIASLSLWYPEISIHLMYGERGSKFVGETWFENGKVDEARSYSRRLDERDYKPRPNKQYGREYTEEENEEYYNNCFHGPFAELLNDSG